MRAVVPRNLEMALRLMAAALLPQSGEYVCPAQADHGGEGVAGGAVAGGVIGCQGVPTAVLDRDPRTGRRCLEEYFDFGELAGGKTLLAPFDYHASGRLPGEYTSDFEWLAEGV